MDKEFIDNALKVMKFDIEDKEKSLIQFVNMHEYGVVTQEKPLLLTLGLQSCIGISSFSFILGSRTGQIIHDGVASKNKITSTRQDINVKGEVDIDR